MIKSPPTELCVFTFYWIAFVVIFQTKLVSFESEFGSIFCLRKKKRFFSFPYFGHWPGCTGSAAGNVGSQPGVPGAATGLRRGTRAQELPAHSPVHRVLLPGCPVCGPVPPGQLPGCSTLPQTTSFLSPTFPPTVIFALTL